jgi:transmembrane 9 superfamily protein 2/4
MSKKMIIWLLMIFNTAFGFYLPGVAPHDYFEGESVPLYVNALGATDDLLAYDYYDPAFHFCQPEGGPVPLRESLGSVLWGDRLYSSPFKLSFLKNTTCALACNPTTIPAEDAKFINQRIMENYNHNWEVDGLPAAEYQDESSFYTPGFDLGSILNEKSYLNNHFEIMVHYHKKDVSTYRVVGVVVTPRR